MRKYMDYIRFVLEDGFFDVPRFVFEIPGLIVNISWSSAKKSSMPHFQSSVNFFWSRA